MPQSIRVRTIKAAEVVLARDRSVGPLELLVQLNFIQFAHYREWKGQNPYYDSLTAHIQCGEKKLQQCYAAFSAWIKEQRLEPFLVQYQGASRNGQVELRITPDGNEQEELFFKTHYRKSGLPDAQKKRIENKKNKAPDLMVFQKIGEPSTCHECEMVIEGGDMFMLEKKQPLCLECADLDHLEFLPSGDATLTRRSRKHSSLSAIVTRFNRRRKRYERQGILVSPQAILKAIQQNEGDADQRARARVKSAERRAEQDVQLVRSMTTQILEMFPMCPPDEAEQMAIHTAERGSGRVGRSAAGRRLDEKAIQLAVNAWIRHQHTEYDSLLMSGVERQLARAQIQIQQAEVVQRWLGNELDQETNE